MGEQERGVLVTRETHAGTEAVGVPYPDAACLEAAPSLMERLYGLVNAGPEECRSQAQSRLELLKGMDGKETGASWGRLRPVEATSGNSNWSWRRYGERELRRKRLCVLVRLCHLFTSSPIQIVFEEGIPFLRLTGTFPPSGLWFLREILRPTWNNERTKMSKDVCPRGRLTVTGTRRPSRKKAF